MSFNEKRSFTEHVVTAPTSDFSFGFEYNEGKKLDEQRINVLVDNKPAEEQGYNVVMKNDVTVELTPDVVKGLVRVQRETNIDNPLHIFSANALFVAKHLDSNFRQVLHSQQEVRDGFTKLYNDVTPLVTGLEEALVQAEEASKAAQEAAEAAEAAAQLSRSASNVWDDVGLNQQQVNDFNRRKVYHVLDLGMQMDGSDETAKLNAIVRDLDNCKLIIGGGKLTLSKTSEYSSDFPNKDQPCIPVIGKTRFTIEVSDGTEIKVPVHAQGAFEFQKCVDTWLVVEGSIEGAGNYPKLDGTTGRGEKGTATEGYNTAGYWGYYKNNSYDTSKSTSGGFGRNFPQWDGGTASTWGKHNGGFIGCQGFGALFHNDCLRGGVRGHGNIKNFNGGGVQIGFNGDYFPVNMGYPLSKDCAVQDIVVSGCFSMGIALLASSGNVVEDCTVINSGHPDAKVTDGVMDAGYGIVGVGSTYNVVEDSYIRRNTVKGCKRKGIDLHGGNYVYILNNDVLDCSIGGIFAAWSNNDVPVRNVVIRGNTIKRCGYVDRSRIVNSVGAIFLQAISTGQALSCTIQDNTAIDCFSYYGVITVRAGDVSTFLGNTVKGVHPKAVSDGNNWTYPAYNFGGTSADIACSSVFASDNYAILNSSMIHGFNTRYGNGILRGNRVTIPLGLTGTPIGMYHLGTSTSKFDYTDNSVTARMGLAYSINNTVGLTERNVATLTDSGVIGNPRNTVLKLATTPLLVTVRVNFATGLPSGATIINGGDLVQAVVSDNFGISVQLKGLASHQVVIPQQPCYMNAEGLLAGVVGINYIYNRAASTSGVVWGLKPSPTATAHVKASDITVGVMDFNILIIG